MLALCALQYLLFGARVDLGVEFAVICFLGCNLLFLDLGFAHNDRGGGRAETRDHILDPECSGIAEPSAMLATVRTDQFTSMRSVGRADNAEVSATGSITINRSIHFDAHSEQRRLRLRDKQVELPGGLFGSSPAVLDLVTHGASAIASRASRQTA
jgi:hypothetical protein